MCLEIDDFRGQYKTLHLMGLRRRHERIVTCLKGWAMKYPVVMLQGRIMYPLRETWHKVLSGHCASHIDI